MNIAPISNFSSHSINQSKSLRCNNKHISMLGKQEQKSPQKGMTLEQFLQCVLSQNEYKAYSDSCKNIGLKYTLPKKYGATIAQRLEKHDFSIPQIFDEIEFGKTVTYKCKDENGCSIEIDFYKPRRYRDKYNNIEFNFNNKKPQNGKRKEESSYSKNKPGSMLYGIEDSLIDDYEIREYKLEGANRIQETMLSIHPYGNRVTASGYGKTQPGYFRISHRFFKDENSEGRYKLTTTNVEFGEHPGYPNNKSIIIHHNLSTVLFDEWLGVNGKYKFDKNGNLSGIEDLYPYEPKD